MHSLLARETAWKYHSEVKKKTRAQTHRYKNSHSPLAEANCR